MLRNKVNLVLLGLVALTIPLAGCGKKSMIKVNGETISKDEFISRLERIPVQTQQGTKMAGQYVVEQIIGERLIEQLAKKENVAPTESQISEKLQAIQKDSGGKLSAILASQGMTVDDLKAKISSEQALINLMSKGVDVPAADVKKAYDQALAAKNSPFKKPEAVRISVIVAKNKAKIDQAYKLLKNGTEFGAVAMQLSEVPGAKESKGQLDYITRDDARAPQIVRATAFATPVGEYSKPFVATNTWIIVKADDKRAASVTKFETVKTTIKEQMAVQKGAMNNTFRKSLQDFTKEAAITVSADRYKRIPDNIKKQAAQQMELPGQKATGTPASSTTK